MGSLGATKLATIRVARYTLEDKNQSRFGELISPHIKYVYGLVAAAPPLTAIAMEGSPR